MDNLKKRIKKAREFAGLNKGDFENVGVSRRSIHRYETEDSSKITLETLLKISDLCKVNKIWLAFGRGEMTDVDSLTDDDITGLEEQNSALTKQFLNQEAQNKILKDLLKIETNPNALKQVQAYIEGVAEGLSYTKDC